MNFSNFSFFDVCAFRVIIQTQIKLQKTFIKLDKYFLNLIYNDIQRFFSKIPNDVKYLIFFHCDFDKQLYVSFFRIKEKSFQTFFNYKKQNEYKNKFIKRLKSNNESEYMSKEFEEFKFQNDIKWKLIVSNNSAQNDKTDRLNETLHRKINIMQTIVNFNIKW